MPIFGEIILIAFISGAMGIAAISVVGLKHASNRPANGELRQIKNLDENILDFHQTIHKIKKANVRAYHGKQATKIFL